MATIRDVAKLAGVSAGTVSNVLNRPSYVSTEVRKRVEAAIAELGFKPTQHARQYRPGRMRTLGVVVASLDNPFFVDVALGTEAVAREEGVSVVFCHSGFDPTKEEYNLDLLVQQRVQGVIITPVEEDSPRLERLMRRGVPVVFADRISGERPCCSIATDHVAGGVAAGEHLAALGHRQVAYIGDPRMSIQVADRLEGFRRAFEAPGREPVQIINVMEWTVQAGIAAGERLVMGDHRPTAVFCANDMIALGVLQRLTANGIRVPEDVAIVGYDDLDLAAAAAVPLTTVRQPRADLGRAAFRLVMNEIDGASGHQHKHIVLDPELIVRRST